MVRKIEMRLESSAIEAILYDCDTKNLNVTFTSGGSYDYPCVPKEIVLGLTNATSAGKYFHQFIKPYADKGYRGN